MNNFRLWCACLMSLLINSIALAQNDAGILYQQKVTREDVSIRQTIKGGRGTIYLTKDSVRFEARKEANRTINFSIAYNQIRSVKRVNPLLFPNRILIIHKDGEKYRLYTYKRKQLIQGILKQFNDS